MLKRLFQSLFAVPLAALLLSPVALHAAGTIPFSMTQQLDQYGVPLSGCQLYIIQAGTTSTPQNAYKDTALTLPHPNPMTCDGSGRLPQFFLADGQIKVRLLDKLGNPQVVLDSILVIGPSSGGGSGATIDSTTIAATGDIKQSWGTQTLTGWVRLNGRTIGNATSGATERANADTQALFLYLWSNDPAMTVSGGRTTAAADYAANKTITLPDARGRVLASLDDMGNVAAGRLTTAFFNVGTTLGATGGSQSHLLSLSELPTGITASGATGTITSSGNNTISVISSQTGVPSGATTGSALTNSTGGYYGPASLSPLTIGQINSSASNAISVSASSINVTSTSNNTGGAAHTTIQPTILVTTYIKL